MEVASWVYNALSQRVRRYRNMPIKTAQEAIEVAERFLQKYRGFRILKQVEHKGNEWIVDFDVAILGSEIVRITLDAEGNVVGYSGVS